MAAENRITEWRKKRGYTVEQLADMCGTAPGQISKLSNGHARLDTEWLEKISSALNIDPLDLIRRPLVNVVGYVGAGQEIYPIDDHAKGNGFEEVEPPPGVDSRKVVAVRVKGDSMEPFIGEGWLMFYSRHQDGVPDDCVGKFCIVCVKDGPTLVKRLKKGYSKGKYNLVSFNAAQRDDVEVEWAAKIIDMRQP